MAEQRANLSGLVVVVNDQPPHPSRKLKFLADGADATLGRENFLVVSQGHVVVMPQTFVRLRIHPLYSLPNPLHGNQLRVSCLPLSLGSVQLLPVRGPVSAPFRVPLVSVLGLRLLLGFLDAIRILLAVSLLVFTLLLDGWHVSVDSKLSS